MTIIVHSPSPVTSPTSATCGIVTVPDTSRTTIRKNRSGAGTLRSEISRSASLMRHHPPFG
jgi:hypothetical protein